MCCVCTGVTLHQATLTTRPCLPPPPPQVGNVAFGSAHDGWAFRTDQFAAMYAEKLGCKPEALRRCLWGDWAFSAKEKKAGGIQKVYGLMRCPGAIVSRRLTLHGREIAAN